jgi:hypothetical protein
MKLISSAVTFHVNSWSWFVQARAKQMVDSIGEIDGFRGPGDCRKNRRSRRLRDGFSFVEVLFAVMILGIGFILIAGIFPVAIGQTQANGDETIAASTARQAVAVIATLPNTSMLMASDGNVHRFGPSGTPVASAFGDPDLALWNELNGSQVLSEDPRYAWVPFYCRRDDASAQITIVAVRARNHEAYVPSANARGDMAVSGSGANALATLIGKPVSFTLNANTSLTTPDTITFTSGSTGAVAPGTFVIIAADTAANAAGSAVGWVLKVGSPTTYANTYFLEPGGDIKNQTTYRPGLNASFAAFIVGQGADPDNAANFSGGAQDIIAFTTFIPLH